jgi:hypothetical protein
LTAVAVSVAVAFTVTGCGKESEAEKLEKERDKLREKKRANAVQFYKTLSEKFPESQRAAEAAQKAKALEAAAPKK